MVCGLGVVWLFSVLFAGCWMLICLLNCVRYCLWFRMLFVDWWVWCCLVCLFVFVVICCLF